MRVRYDDDVCHTYLVNYILLLLLHKPQHKSCTSQGYVHVYIFFCILLHHIKVLTELDLVIVYHTWSRKSVFMQCAHQRSNMISVPMDLDVKMKAVMLGAVFLIVSISFLIYSLLLLIYFFLLQTLKHCRHQFPLIEI